MTSLTDKPVNLFYDRFSNLAVYPGLRHGIFQRHGGFSSPPYDSLNVGLGIGDDPERVRKNRQRIIHQMGSGKPVFLNQVHGDTLLVINSTAGDMNRPLADNGRTADGVITNVPGLLLVIQVADCQPVLLYDPVKHVVANIHSGWRGSIQDIIGTAVRTMKDAFGSDPADLLAGIGPSLGPCCAEFIHYRREIPEALWKYRIDEHHFDFWSLSRDQLTAQGVSGSRIEISGVCTRCRPDAYFSYRHDRVTGRFASVIGLL